MNKKIVLLQDICNLPKNSIKRERCQTFSVLKINKSSLKNKGEISSETGENCGKMGKDSFARVKR